MKKNTFISVLAFVLLPLLITASCNPKKLPDGNSVETVKDIDGNIYHTVKIGTQIWMVENLKTTKYNDGTEIPLVTDYSIWAALLTPAYCWYSNDATTYKNRYGALYNWAAVSTAKLAPIGWHVPNEADWTTVTTYLGGETVAGGKLKEAGTLNWTKPNAFATNQTNFSALPGGYRLYNGTFDSVGENGFWWSSTESDWRCAESLWMTYNYGASVGNSISKQSGFSVRCVKD